MAAGKVTVVSLVPKLQRCGQDMLVWADCIGPDKYLAGGVQFNVGRALEGMRYLKYITATCGKGTTTVRYLVIPLIDSILSKLPDIRTPSASVLFMFINIATGVEPADDTDLTAVRFRIEARGTLG